MDIRFYLYIDKEGIDSLYNQIPDMQYDSINATSSVLNGKGEGSIEFKTPLKLLGSASVGTEIDAKYEVSQEQHIKITYEQKIELIHKNLNNGKVDLLTDILDDDVIINDRLIVGKGLFRLNEAYDDKNGCSLTEYAIKSKPYSYKELSFNFCSIPTLGLVPNDKSPYSFAYDNRTYYVDMFMSGEKMVRSVRHITNQLKYNKDFMFTVLGHISNEGNKIFSLKPYAIWRETDKNI